MDFINNFWELIVALATLVISGGGIGLVKNFIKEIREAIKETLDALNDCRNSVALIKEYSKDGFTEQEIKDSAKEIEHSIKEIEEAILEVKQAIDIGIKIWKLITARKKAKNARAMAQNAKTKARRLKRA